MNTGKTNSPGLDRILAMSRQNLEAALVANGIARWGKREEAGLWRRAKNTSLSVLRAEEADRQGEDSRAAGNAGATFANGRLTYDIADHCIDEGQS